MRFPKFLSFGGRGSASPPVVPEAFEVDRVIYAIGDLHGRADLLAQMLEKIAADAAKTRRGRAVTVVFLGDYVDRGPDARKVIEELSVLTGSSSDIELVFLMGNHERAMLDFISNPSSGRRWLGMGGFQTLKSYDVRAVHPGADDDAMFECADALKNAIGPHMRFLRDRLRLSHTVGNVLLVHAAAQHGVEPEEQPENVLLWGSAEFMKKGGPSGYWTVHGHTITDDPECHVNRIGVDTGAYLSGVLSAARIDSDGVGFLQVSA